MGRSSMGWKSTLRISREDAIAAILAEYAKVHQMTNDELETLMDSMFGDDVDRPYYGHNFLVVDVVDEDD